MFNNFKNSILKTVILFFLFSVQFVFSFPVSVQAQDGKTYLVNPLGGTKDSPKGTYEVEKIGSSAITRIMGVLGSITLLVFVAGGVMWLTSGGNQERVQMGSKTMLYAIIGIFVIFASYAILNTIIKGVTGTG